MIGQLNRFVGQKITVDCGQHGQWEGILTEVSDEDNRVCIVPDYTKTARHIAIPHIVCIHAEPTR